MSQTEKKKKKLPVILLVIVLLIAAAAGLLAYHSAKNTKIMNETIQKGLDTLNGYYQVTPLDAGEYQDMRIYGLMKFHVDQYAVKDLGNLSVMTADMGMMQMVSFMITPFEKNVPLCTLDFMYIMSNRKSYIEFYDLVGDPHTEEYTHVLDALRQMQARYDDIEELEASENWYDSYLSVVMHKKLSAKDEQRNQDMFCDALESYLAASAELEKSSDEDAAKQLAVTESYSSGLIENGGVSTDVFKKALGADTTRDFFRKVFFGTDRYR